MKKVFLAIMLVLLVAPLSIAKNDGNNGNNGKCVGNCPTKSSFSGEHAQMSVAFVDQAIIEDGIVVDGSQAMAAQGTDGTFYGKGNGAGITGGAGITFATTTNKNKVATSVAFAANVGLSAADAKQSCAKLNGFGEAQTVAVKDGGIASSAGNFAYQGQGNMVVGAGLTGGGSFVATGKNTVISGAAHVSAAGVSASGK